MVIKRLFTVKIDKKLLSAFSVHLFSELRENNTHIMTNKKHSFIISITFRIFSSKGRIKKIINVYKSCKTKGLYWNTY